jgi:pilus assembly protein Flp/PilA
MVQLYTMFESLRSRLTKDDGVTAVEYALIAALIAVAIIAAVVFLGGAVKGTFNHVGSAVDGTASS